MKRFFIKLIITLTLFAIIVVGGSIWFKGQSKVSAGTIDIYQGATVRQVADLLQLNGMIENADVFYYYIRAKQVYYEFAPWSSTKFDVNFKSGNFKIDSTNFDTLIAELNSVDNAADSSFNSYVTIPEGSTIVDISKILAEKNIVDANAFLQLANDPNYYLQLKQKYLWLPDYNSQKKYQLEGYLEANTYDFKKNTLPNKIIERMMDETNKWYEDNKIQIMNSGHTFDQLLTLASVVEKESKFKEDRPKVAQVFYNRLSIGMKLESDITAAYAEGKHVTVMTNKDISINSPYNTYKVSGLPIGPIDSPSKDSFIATLNPVGSQFKALYFYARPNGQTFYANTLAEHQQNVNKYQKEWLSLNK